MTRLFTVRQIHACQKGQGREHGKNVGKELGGRKGEENKNKQGPYQEESTGPILQPFLRTAENTGQGAAPGIKSGKKHHYIEPVMVLSRMLRAHETGHIVVAQKGVDEGAAVDMAHGYIPGKAYQAGQWDAPVPFEAQDFLHMELLCKNHPDAHNEGRKTKAHRPLGEERQTAEYVGCYIFPPEEGHEGDGKGQRKEGIGDTAPGKNDDFKRSGADESTPEGSLSANELSGGKIQVHRGEGAQKEGRKSSGPGRNAKQAERQRFQPVEERRLVVPEFPVNAGRKEIAGGYHFLGRFPVHRFIGVQKWNGAKKGAVEDNTEKKEEDTVFIQFHFDFLLW